MQRENKKMRNIRITEKDQEIINFIGKFGFATNIQIHKYLGGSLESLKKRLSLMVVTGYLVNHRILFGEPSVYTITDKANLTDLGIVKEITLRDYKHDLLVTDVYLQIRDKFVNYTTEKMLRAERGIGVGSRGRLPDLIGHMRDRSAIAIEVDRTDKSMDRLKKIIDEYSTNFDYSEVWFYARNDFIYNNLEKCTQGLYKFKIYKLEELGL